MSTTTQATDKLILAEVVHTLKALTWAAYLITKNNGHEISPLDVSIIKSEVQNAEKVLEQFGIK